MKIEFNENRDLCKKCGGICCKKFGCEIFPEDVIKRYNEISEETLCQLINTGYVSIDCWTACGNPGKLHPKKEMYEYDRIFFLRMRHINKPICDIYSMGPCKALTEYGCMLDWDNRPTGGKLLVPNASKCIVPMEDELGLSSDTELAALMWFEYNSLLEKLYNNFLNL